MRLATGFLLFATGAAWLAWELVLVWGRARGEGWATISIVLKDAAMKACVLPFGIGLLSGHWFVLHDLWDRSTWFSGWWLWVAVASALLLVDVLLWGHAREAWPLWARVVRYPGLWLVVGVVLGFAAWPQRAVL